MGRQSLWWLVLGLHSSLPQTIYTRLSQELNDPFLQYHSRKKMPASCLAAMVERQVAMRSSLPTLQVIGKRWLGLSLLDGGLTASTVTLLHTHQGRAEGAGAQTVPCRCQCFVDTLHKP